MFLQGYFTYIVLFGLATIQTVHTDASDKTDLGDVNSSKQTRGIIDLVVGRLRPCGICTCGRANRGGRFLVGEFADSHEYPWLAIIYVKSKRMFNGVLINDRYVLTAATPLTNLSITQIKIALGQHNRCHHDISSTNNSIDAIIQHNSFDYDSSARDLALLRLSRPIKFEKRISPICLPNPGSDYLGQVGTLIGWSEKDPEHDDKTCRPRKVGLPILGKQECFKDGVKSNTFHSDSGCAGVIGTAPIACSDDSGAGIFYRSYNSIYDLVGILSDANDCHDDDKGAAVYTKIGPHLDWILKNTKDACFCTK